MARFGRRRSETATSEEWPDAESPAPAPVVVADTAAPTEAGDGLPHSRLRGNEITYGYVVGALIAVASVIMLVVTKGKGAPTHPNPVWASLGVVFGLSTIFSIRFSNRLLTAMIAIFGGFVAGQVKTPNSLTGVRIVALLAPVLYGVLIFRRQSKADRARRTAQTRARAAERRAARAGGGTAKAGAGKGRPVPGRPAPSGRYTPPKARRRR